MANKNKSGKSRSRKTEKLNSQNAQSVANRGMNAAYSQAHGVLERDENGNWREGRGYSRSVTGKMSTNGRTAGGLTWAQTQKDDNGNKVRQSGRSKMASRRQRYYDVRVGLGLSGG
ncbi:MAG: hypothetical protein LIP02_04020 [Bacteroidales bacterium]|nr:hypothetical protein [Bacteroidales bacterium]